MGNTFKCQFKCDKHSNKQKRISQLTQSQITQQSSSLNSNQFVPAKPLLAQQTGIKCKTGSQSNNSVGCNFLSKSNQNILQKPEEQNLSLAENNIQDNYFDKNELVYYNQQPSKFKKRKRVIGKRITWKQGDLIGQGSFGKVYKGLNLETGELIAIKQLIITGNSEEQKSKKKTLEHEIELLSTLQHKNIVKYYGIEKNKETVNIFLEYVSGGCLQSMIKKFGSLNENLVRLYTKQIMEGLEYLHFNEVLHRDIKGANVLIEKNGTAKLSDFGSAKRIVVQLNGNIQTQTMTGTPNWMAPEVIKQSYLGRFSDIWSLGCTVIEMATGKAPYYQYESSYAAMLNIAQNAEPPLFPENCSSVLHDFLGHCFK